MNLLKFRQDAIQPWTSDSGYELCERHSLGVVLSLNNFIVRDCAMHPFGRALFALVGAHAQTTAIDIRD